MYLYICAVFVSTAFAIIHSKSPAFFFLKILTRHIKQTTVFFDSCNSPICLVSVRVLAFKAEILAVIQLATCLFIFQFFYKTLVYPFKFLDLFLQFLKIFNEFVVFLFAQNFKHKITPLPHKQEHRFCPLPL